MGFSNFMGLMGGMARAGEQVADKTLERMDASAIAKAKEEAQLRLEERTQRRAIENREAGYKREDFTYKRGLMDDQAKLKDSRDYAIKHEQDQYNLGRSRILDAIEDSNAIYTGSKEKQEGAAKIDSEIEKNKAQAQHEIAQAKKTMSEIGAGGAKPLTESEVAARVEVGDKGLKVAYNIGTDPITGQFTGKAEDIKGYITAKSRLERAVRNGESLPSAYVEKVFSGSESEKSAEKAASDERAQRGIDSLNKNKPTLRFKDYTREEFDALPKEEQDKAINQGKAPSAPKQSTPATKFAPITPQAAPKGKVITAPDGTKYISTGTGLKPYTEPAKQETVRPAETKKASGLMGQASAPSNATVDVDSEVAQAEAELAQAQKEEEAVNQKIAANEARRKNEKGNIAPANDPKLVTKQYENASKAINAKIDEALAKKDFAAADAEYKKLSRAGEIANKQLEIKKLTDTLSRLGSGHENDKKDIRARIAKLKAEM